MAKKEIVPVEVRVDTTGANKEINKTQSAVKNVLSGIGNGLKNAGSSILKFGKTAAAAFTSVKAAAAAVNFGFIIDIAKKIFENWEKIEKVITNFIPGFSKLVGLVKGFFQSITDFLGLTSEAERTADALVKQTERQNEALDDQIKVLQAVGGQEEKIYKIQKEKNANELNSLRERLRLLGTLTEEEQKRFRELKTEQVVLDASEKKRIADEQKSATEKAKSDAEKAAAEKKKKEEEAKQKKKEADEAALNRILAGRLDSEQLEELNNKRKEIIKDENSVFTKGYDDRLKAIGKEAQVRFDIQDAAYKQQKAIEDQEKANAEFKKAAFESEVALAQQSLSIIGGLLDQNSAAGKSVAIAQAIINTYQGASKALAQGGIFGPVAAAATIAAGLIQVKKIVSTKIPSVSGGTVAEKGVSVGASAPISPTPNIQATLTQLDQGTVNRLGSASARAYVVESDITSSQEKIKRINRAARLS